VRVTDATNRTATSPAVTVNVGNTYHVFVTSPTAGQQVSGTSWAQIWWEGASGAAPTYTLTVDSVVVGGQAANGQPTAVPWDTTRAGDGTRTLLVSARDGAGNTTTASVSVNVSNMTAAVISPTAGATVSATVTVNMRATGTTGTSNTFVLSIDGAVASTQTVAGTTASFSWNTKNILNGNHTLSVRVTDATGRSVTSPTVTVNVSNAFAVFITAPGNGATVSGTTWLLVWWEGASVSAPNYTVSVDGQTVAQQAANGQPTSIPWNTAGTANGTHTLTVTGVDGAAHTSAPSISVNVSN